MFETTATIKIIYNFFVFIISGLLAYLNMDKEVIALFSVLLVIDYLTGLHKARILGHSITSNKMKYGLISKILLLLIPITLAIGGKAVGADFHYVVLASMNILIISEVYSIIGNIYASSTKEEFPEWDAVAMIGKKIRTFLIKLSGDKDA